MRLGRLAPHLGYSRCYRCKTPWYLADRHDTTYIIGRGLCPLCKKCWAELTPEQRLPFYRKLLQSWDYEGRDLTFEQTWEAVRTAVLEGN